MSAQKMQGDGDNNRIQVPIFTIRPTGSRISYTEERRHVAGESGTKAVSVLTLMYFGCIIVVMLCALSCITILYRNTKIMERNLELLGKLELRTNSQFPVQNDGVEALNVGKGSTNLQGEPLTPMEPYENLMLVLNEELNDDKTQYKVIQTCIDPPMFECKLKIDDLRFIGKEFFGKGSNQQQATQAAAWDAIKKDFPELEFRVSENYNQLSILNLVCKKPALAL